MGLGSREVCLGQGGAARMIGGGVRTRKRRKRCLIVEKSSHPSKRPGPSAPNIQCFCDETGGAENLSYMVERFVKYVRPLVHPSKAAKKFVVHNGRSELMRDLKP